LDLADELMLTARERLTVLESNDEVLRLEALYAPEGTPPPAHWHPTQDEHFEVLEGEMKVVAGGDERELRKGDTLDIPSGTVHQMWNPSAAPARVSWEVRSPGRTEQWFRTVDELFREGPIDENGMPPLEPLIRAVNEYSDVFRLGEP
jgi:mannose-6-phosphate isomerase-like protein (cupin superfamily)